MRWWHRLFHRRQHEEQLEKEVRHHLDLHTSDLIAEGYSPEEAQRQAHLALGGPEQVKELCRDARGTRWFENLLQDLRIGVRMLRKNPGFTFVVAATLALGIGANTAIFGLVDAMLLRPLPIVNAPGELVLLVRGDGRGPSLSYPDFRHLRERNEVLSDLALYTQAPISFGNNVHSEVVLGAMVSGNYFDVLGIKPAFGRAFLPEEDRTPDTHPVVVLNHNFWQTRFNSDRTLVGQTIVLNSQRFTVVGIAPAGFDGESPPMKVSLWIPVMMTATMKGEPRQTRHNPLSNRQDENFGAIGRLKQGVSITQAQAALETINRQLEPSNPAPPEQGVNTTRDRALRLLTPEGIMLGPIREMAVTSSGLAGAAVLAVLLIACANVANLLMARATTRRKEVAVRLALGATRGRLIRQLLTESVLLALAGATAGLFLAYWINQLLMAFKPPFPPPFTFALDLSFDTRTFGFTFLLAIATGMIFGLVPALQATRPDVLPALKDESNAEGVRVRWLNWRNALVITQVALSLALLISTGLFLRTLRYAERIDLGFNPDHVLGARFNLRLQRYNEVQGREFYQRIVERVERLPGVQTVSVTNQLPLGFMWITTPVVPEDREVPPDERVFAGGVSAGSQYFETVGTPLIRGRDFSAQDTIKSPQVAIVSEKLARLLWPEIKDPGEAWVSGCALVDRI
jgi:predicted permease